MSASQQATKTIVSAIPHEMGGNVAYWEIKRKMEFNGFEKTYTYFAHATDPMTDEVNFASKPKEQFTQSEIAGLIPADDIRFDSGYDRNQNPPNVPVADTAFDFLALSA